MRKLFAILILAASGLAHAADDAVYRDFGQKPGIQALMQDFVARLKADAKIGHYFKETKTEHLVTQLTDQLCKVSGGPCVYEGATMAESHRDLEINRADFNRLVEVLQDAMDAKGIPFRAQNRMLALLAPMHRDIVTR